MTIKTIALLGAGFFWIAAAGTGLTRLYDYETTAGVRGYVARQWPAGTAIPRDSRPYQLIMFAHPQCPCTRASVGELELILAKEKDRVGASVVFIKPESMEESWVRSGLFKTAGSIPGVSVRIDEGGSQAKLFGATVSGQTFLYDVRGELIFEGGITGARGHSGDNAGRSAIEAMINDRSPLLTKTPFFGCMLHDEPVRKQTPGEQAT